MKKILFVVLTCITSFGWAENATQTYAEFTFMDGLYKVKVAEEESMPTALMAGFSTAVGFLMPMNSSLYFRGEGIYVFGYRMANDTNYSSMMARVGFEINPDGKAKVVPYILIGGGMVAADPPRASVWTAPGWDASFGARILLEKGYSLVIGSTYTNSVMHYPEKEHASRIEKMMYFIGINKKF